MNKVYIFLFFIMVSVSTITSASAQDADAGVQPTQQTLLERIRPFFTLAGSRPPAMSALSRDSGELSQQSGNCHLTAQDLRMPQVTSIEYMLDVALNIAIGMHDEPEIQSLVPERRLRLANGGIQTIKIQVSRTGNQIVFTKETKVSMMAGLHYIGLTYSFSHNGDINQSNQECIRAGSHLLGFTP